MRPVPDHEGPQALQPVESIVSDNKPQVLVDLLAPSADPTEHYSDIASSQDKPASSPPVRRESRFSRKRPWIWALATVMLLVIVAIVVGCAVPLTHRHKEQRSPTNPVSTVGALNGSGMVMLDEGEGSSQIVAYVQSGDGNIRKLEYLDGRWSGAQKADVVDVLASNPRNGTPVMALAYDRREERIWRVFYVDVDDFLQESIYSNKTQGGWSSGLLGLGRFKASSSKHVGLTACYNPQWYGEPYNSSDGGIRLYYGASNHTVQELLWANGNGAWDNGSNFPDSNGDGGVECTVRNRSVTNVWLLNSNNQLEQRWREFNRSAQTATHPAGTWVSGLLLDDLPTLDAMLILLQVSIPRKYVQTPPSPPS